MRIHVYVCMYVYYVGLEAMPAILHRAHGDKILFDFNVAIPNINRDQTSSALDGSREEGQGQDVEGIRGDAIYFSKLLVRPRDHARSYLR